MPRYALPKQFVPLLISSLLVVAMLIGNVPVAAQSQPPSLAVNRSVVTPGMRLTLTLAGFTPQIDLTALWNGGRVADLGPAVAGSFTRTLEVPLDAQAGPATLSVCAALSDGTCFTGEFAQQAEVQLLVEPGLRIVPAALLRRAATFVAELRGSPLVPNWAEARLGTVARPLYRPDLGDVPAYYEIEVLGTPTLGQQLEPNQAPPPADIPAGFVILATGEHDLPIPHWHSEGPALTEQMRAQAQANGQAAPERFFKLDTLAYAAQGPKGEVVATLGSELVRIVGASPDLHQTFTEDSMMEWSPDPEGGEGTTIERGPGTPDGPALPDGFSLAEWESWEALKAGYTEAYTPYIANLRDLAAEAWTFEREASTFGLGLRVGDIYHLPLVAETGAASALAATPTVALSGPGETLVEGELVENEGPLPFYRITVIADRPGTDVELMATVTYEDNTSEQFTFFIISTLPNRLYLPLALVGNRATRDPFAQSGGQLAQSWGPWRFWWAGTNADQRIYRQLRRDEGPNTSRCVSGCGATAWAMLFGWVDQQAHNNVAPWVGSEGIYRTGGFATGSPAAIAPPRMNNPLTTEQQGVATMTWEIRERIGTFCAAGNGATFPWRMSDARRYLQNRSPNPLRTDYSSVGIKRDRFRNAARDSIVLRGTPAIIGTGWLSHYPLAYGYAERTRRVRSCNIFGRNCSWKTEFQRSFFVNQGWAGSDDNLAWVSSGTWFVGQIYPTR
ncbi:hypothetical protein [Candidatus Chloroploca sp. Khr17]|uniref:hypothetical protein n=1 Tax=Candidatus Chloroploca sp. Khr17 TaxID=2496869 RepID=UPI00101D02FC|nr:hypothetical protein [Candidatus Chloroploca sp. Khr17]